MSAKNFKTWKMSVFQCLMSLIFLTTFLIGLGSSETYHFVTKWGTSGTGDGQFSYPHGIAVDGSGNVYVADTFNNRIQKFDSNGTFLFKWGTSGTGDGQFSHPSSLTVLFRGDLYVADTFNNRIQYFYSYSGKWETFGGFSSPCGIAMDGSGNVYVADTFNNRIQHKFESSGCFCFKWGSSGTGDGQFSFPFGIAVDGSAISEFNVYVADSGNNRIQKFIRDSTFVTKWGTSGTGDGQFSFPCGIAVDSSGNVYVADTNNSRIQKFAPSSSIITTSSATNVTPHSATLNGIVNPNGSYTTYYFQWGTTSSYGNITASLYAGTYPSDVPVSANLTGLTPNTSYHYRLVGTSIAGTTYGADMTFKTLSNAMPWLMLLLGD